MSSYQSTAPGRAWANRSSTDTDLWSPVLSPAHSAPDALTCRLPVSCHLLPPDVRFTTYLQASDSKLLMMPSGCWTLATLNKGGIRVPSGGPERNNCAISLQDRLDFSLVQISQARQVMVAKALKSATVNQWLRPLEFVVRQVSLLGNDCLYVRLCPVSGASAKSR
jgi:hypothetical protein